jgi:hypothetical protein
MYSMDPGPHGSKWNMHVWQEAEGPSLGSAPPNSYVSASRDSEDMEATQGSSASPHSGCTAAKSGYQQSEHVTF